MEEQKVQTLEMSSENLKQVATHFQQRAIAAESRLKSIDFVSIRLTWLFKVLKHEDMFEATFVEACIKEIQELLTLPKEEDSEEDQ